MQVAFSVEAALNLKYAKLTKHVPFILHICSKGILFSFKLKCINNICNLYVNFPYSFKLYGIPHCLMKIEIVKLISYTS